jgi:uncharacterized glyoxalase superfamily protein PhnB
LSAALAGSGPTVIPTLRYDDAPAALAWLTGVFGFKENLVVPGDEGTIAHAQLLWEGGLVMISSATDGDPDRGPSWTYLITDDVDGHRDRATAAGAAIVHPLVDQDYGGRGYTARDAEGNLWSVGSYRPEVPRARSIV